MKCFSMNYNFWRLFSNTAYKFFKGWPPRFFSGHSSVDGGAPLIKCSLELKTALYRCCLMTQ